MHFAQHGSSPSQTNSTTEPASTLRSPNDRAWFAAQAIVVAASLIVGLYRLSSPSIWFDEAYTWYIVSGDWPRFWHEAARGNDCGGFVYALILKLWTIPFGHGEISLRLPSVLSAAATATVLVQIGKELHSLRAGLFMAVLAVFHPEVIIWSRQARAYSLEILLTAVYLLTYLRYARTYVRTSEMLTAVVGTLLCLTHLFGVFVVAGSGLHLLIRRFSPTASCAAQRLFAVWPTLIPVPFLAAWTLALRSRIDENLNSFWIQASLVDSYLSMVNSFGILVPLTVVCCIVGGIRVLQGRATPQERLMLATVGCVALSIFSGPLIVSMLSRGRHHFIIERYHFPALVLMFICVGYYVARLPLKPTLLVVTAVSAIVFHKRNVRNVYEFEALDGSRTRDAAAYLERHRLPGDVVFVEPNYERVTALYYGIHGSSSSPPDAIADSMTIPATIPAVSPAAPDLRKWVMVYRVGLEEIVAPFGERDAPQTAFGTLRLVLLEPARRRAVPIED